MLEITQNIPALTRFRTPAQPHQPHFETGALQDRTIATASGTLYIPLIIEPQATETASAQLKALGFEHMVTWLRCARASVLNNDSMFFRDEHIIPWRERGPVDAEIALLTNALCQTAAYYTEIFRLEEPGGFSQNKLGYYLSRGMRLRKPRGIALPRDTDIDLFRTLFGAQNGDFDQLVRRDDINGLSSVIAHPICDFGQNAEMNHICTILNSVAATAQYHIMDRSISDKDTGCLLAIVQQMIDRFPDPIQRLALTLAYQGVAQLAIIRSNKPYELTNGFMNALLANQRRLAHKNEDHTIRVISPKPSYDHSEEYARKLAHQLVVEGIAINRTQALIAARSQLSLT